MTHPDDIEFPDEEWEEGKDAVFKRLIDHLKPAHASLYDHAQQQTAMIIANIQKIDRQIDWVDRLLYYSQPPTSGRIRFYAHRHGPEPRMIRPIFVSWTRIGKAKGQHLWRIRHLKNPAAAIKSKGGFVTHRSEVIKLIQIGSYLLKRRSEIMQLLGNLGRSWTQKERHLDKRVDRTLDELYEIVQRLNAKGMNLDPDDVMP